jgi:hypothetical protein
MPAPFGVIIGIPAYRPAFEADMLPIELRDERRFVVWKSVSTETGAITKPPYQCKDTPA